MGTQSLARAAGDLFAFVLGFQAAPDASRPSAAAIRSQVLGLLDGIGKHADARDVPPPDIEAARFALAAWTDETLSLGSWSGRAEWEKDPLQFQLFGTRRAGVEFFERLQQLGDGQGAALEIYYLCMALGFQGDYYGREGDRQALLSRAYEKLKRAGRAVDVGREGRLTPTAYNVDVELEESRVWGLPGRLLLLGAGLFAVWGILWFVLHWTAGGVPLPKAF